MSTATQSLRPLWEGVRHAWRTSPVPAFLGWWGAELRALLPPRWRVWFSDGADWYLLQRVDGEWSLRPSGSVDPVARWSDDADASVRQSALNAALQNVDHIDLHIALVLPATAVLQRTLALPLAARDNLQQVVAFEMDRQTPFSVADVYYSAHALPTPAPAGRFNAELLVVRRRTLDPLLASLQSLGVPIDAVDLAVGAGRFGANLLPPAQVPKRSHPRLRLNLALAAGAVLLVFLLLGQWLHNRQAVLERMQARVESMRGEAQQVVSLRQQLQDNAGAAGYLAQRKKNTVSVLSLLQDVTTRLPTTAWLERFSVDNTGQIGLQGQAVQAAKLLDALKDSRVLTQASFQGSIQADPTTGKERFYLTAKVPEPIVQKAKSAAAAVPASSGSRP
ncbi:MAG: PilN domain-containing protein [Rhodanobacter sp.]